MAVRRQLALKFRHLSARCSMVISNEMQCQIATHCSVEGSAKGRLICPYRGSGALMRKVWLATAATGIVGRCEGSIRHRQSNSVLLLFSDHLAPGSGLHERKGRGKASSNRSNQVCRQNEEHRCSSKSTKEIRKDVGRRFKVITMGSFDFKMGVDQCNYNKWSKWGSNDYPFQATCPRDVFR